MGYAMHAIIIDTEGEQGLQGQGMAPVPVKPELTAEERQELEQQSK